MRPLNATELLNVWEYGLNQPILQRALILIAAASTEMDSQAVAELTIGERDARLLQLREWMFGSLLLNMAQCPQCGEKVEWQCTTTDLTMQAVADVNSAEDYSMELDGYQLRFRLPNSLDIAAVVPLLPTDNEENFSVKVGATELVKRCIISASYGGQSCSFNELSQQVVKGLGEKIKKLDPQAEVTIALTCPECEHLWQVPFDIASFLWTEINSWAEGTIRSIHQLAKAYGWTESEILNLSPIRRQLYLGMVN